ncbi:glycine-rich domain-containing protein [Phenylobacterium sp.]
MLLVGGGGAGDSGQYIFDLTWGMCSAGGGGGEVLEVELVAPPPGAYAVEIGPGGVAYGTPGGGNIHGGQTKFGPILRAIGGGGGGALFSQSSYENAYATTGFNTAGAPRAAWTPAGRVLGGFSGGTSFANYSSIVSGGGGGGSGGPGGNATSGAPGLGGVGKFSSLTGLPVEYGRGGTGGHTSVGRGAPAFGPGGGGGGGRPQESNTLWGEPGNAGFLAFRYLTGTQTWTGGNVTQFDSWTIHTFTADGTATRTA